MAETIRRLFRPPMDVWRLHTRPGPRHMRAVTTSVRAACFAFLLAFFGTPIAISFYVRPGQIERGEVHLSPQCFLLRYTGHECPTCGMTRAFIAISHGDLATAR